MSAHVWPLDRGIVYKSETCVLHVCRHVERVCSPMHLEHLEARSAPGSRFHWPYTS